MTNSNPAPKLASRLYVGIDISANSFEFATFQPEFDPKPKNASRPLPQDPTGFESLWHHLAQLEFPPTQISVVLEATGTYWVSLALFLYQHDLVVCVINPAQAHYFAQALLRRNKNDRLDAALLAQLAYSLQNQLVKWTPPPLIYHEFEQRLSQRQVLLTMLHQLENQLHALRAGGVLIEAVVQRHQTVIQTLKTELASLETELKKLLQAENDWTASVKLLLTINGIGMLSALWLVVLTHNFSTCQTPEQLTAYLGLVPLEHSSGTSVKARPTLGRSGQPAVRSILYMASLSASRHNPLIKSFATRLKQAGKAPKVVQCACARKLVHLAWGVVRSGKAFDPTYLATKQPAVALAELVS